MDTFMSESKIYGVWNKGSNSYSVSPRINHYGRTWPRVHMCLCVFVCVCVCIPEQGTGRVIYAWTYRYLVQRICEGKIHRGAGAVQEERTGKASRGGRTATRSRLCTTKSLIYLPHWGN
jgi:hypothetical protein